MKQYYSKIPYLIFVITWFAGLFTASVYQIEAAKTLRQRKKILQNNIKHLVAYGILLGCQPFWPVFAF
jgi:uncharacterized membrane protein